MPNYKPPPGRKLLSQEDIDEVKNFFKENKTELLHEAARELGIAITNIWCILKKSLK